MQSPLEPMTEAPNMPSTMSAPVPTLTSARSPTQSASVSTDASSATTVQSATSATQAAPSNTQLEMTSTMSNTLSDTSVKSNTQSLFTPATLTASPLSTLSDLTTTTQSDLSSSTQSASTTIPTSAMSSASPTTPVSTVLTSAVDAYTAPFVFSSQLPTDLEQMKFTIGGSSRSPHKVYAVKPPSSVTITPVPATPGNPAGLFGSEIVAEASRAPGRFKFQTSCASAKTIEKRQAKRDSELPPRLIHTARSHAGNSSQTQRVPYLPMLGPDVVIRPVSSNQVKNYDRTPKQNSQPRLNDSETFQLLAGYQHLKDEVASLKVQLSNSQALMGELLTSFSSEVAKINIRLTVLEQERINERTGHDQGRIGHDQGRTEHNRRSMENGQGIEYQRSNIDESGDKESHEQESLNAELKNLTLTKEANEDK